MSQPVFLTFGRALRAALVILPFAFTAQGARAQTGAMPPPDPTGEWLVDKKIARIKIANCDGRMWGVVAWEAQAGIDTNNPDAKLRTRPTLGMPILLGMAPSKPNTWEGQIYNSQDGRTYSASISLVNPNTLRVQGCVLGFLCGGENWTRYEAPPPSPDAVPLPRPAPSAASRKAAASAQANMAPGQASQANASDDVCLRLFPRLPHERGLK